MMKKILIIIALFVAMSCTKEEYKEHEKDFVTVEQDTTTNEIVIDINIECYGSNQ